MEKSVKFGAMAVQMGLVSQAQVDECLQIQKGNANKGKWFYLGQIMVAKKYVTDLKIPEILKAQKLKTVLCPHCQKSFNAPLTSQPTACSLCGKSLENSEEIIEEIEELDVDEETAPASNAPLPPAAGGNLPEPPATAANVNEETADGSSDEIPASLSKNPLLFAEGQDTGNDIWNVQTERSVGKYDASLLFPGDEQDAEAAQELFSQNLPDAISIDLDEILPAPGQAGKNKPVQQKSLGSAQIPVTEPAVGRAPTTAATAKPAATTPEKKVPAAMIKSTATTPGKKAPAETSAIPEAATVNLEELPADESSAQMVSEEVAEPGANSENSHAQAIPEAVLVNLETLADQATKKVAMEKPQIPEAKKSSKLPEPLPDLLDSIPVELDLDDLPQPPADVPATPTGDPESQESTKPEASPMPNDFEPEPLAGVLDAKVMQQLQMEQASPSDTFGLMPVGDAIDFDGNKKKGPNPDTDLADVFPLGEIDFAKMGIELPKSLLGEPTTQTQEWNFHKGQQDQELLGALSANPPKSIEEAGEIESDFFDAQSADPASATLRVASNDQLRIPPDAGKASQSFQTGQGLDLQMPGSDKKGSSQAGTAFGDGIESKRSSLADLKLPPAASFHMPVGSNSEIPDLLGAAPDTGKKAGKETGRKAPKAPRPSARRAGGTSGRRSERKPPAGMSKQNMFLLLIFGALILVLVVIALVALMSNSGSVPRKSSRAENTMPPVNTASTEPQNKSPNNSTKATDPDPKTQTPASDEPKILKEGELDVAYAKAKKLYEQNKPVEASKLFTQILQQKNNYQDARLYQADCSLQLGDLENAQKYAMDTIAQKPSAWAYTIVGMCNEKRKNLEDASQSYLQAINCDANYTRAHRAVARVLCIQGKYVEALRYAIQANKLGDRGSDAEINTIRDNLGKKVVSLGKSPKTIQLLESAIEYDQDFPSYYISLAMLLWNTNPEKSLKMADIFLTKSASLVGDNFRAQEKVAHDIGLVSLYSLNDYNELEKRARANLSGERKEIPLGDILAMVQTALYKNKQAKTKEERSNFHKTALIYYYVFDRSTKSIGEVYPQFLSMQPWLVGWSESLAKELGDDLSKVKDKYIKNWIKLDVVISDANQEIVPFQAGDTIVTANGAPIYTFLDILILAKNRRLEKMAVDRKGNVEELSVQNLSSQMLGPPHIKYVYRIQLMK